VRHEAPRDPRRLKTHKIVAAARVRVTAPLFR